MAGAIIENMSTRKLCIVGGILLVFQVIAFLVGGLIGECRRAKLSPPAAVPALVPVSAPRPHELRSAALSVRERSSARPFVRSGLPCGGEGPEKSLPGLLAACARREGGREPAAWRPVPRGAAAQRAVAALSLFSLFIFFFIPILFFFFFFFLNR